MIEFVRYMWNDGIVGKLVTITIVIVVALIPVAIIQSIEEEKQWKAFAAEHNCKVVGHMRPQISTGIGFGIGANGQPGTAIISTTTPSRTGYLCDDGITYWR